MPSPFPGMDPWLEHPRHWHDLHTRFVVEMGNELAARLAPRYVVRVEQRVYRDDSSELALVGLPDVSVMRTGEKGSASARGVGVCREPSVITLPMPVEIRERYLEVQKVGTGEVVTIIEIISPSNKEAGEGRESYEKKRAKVLATLTSLVEIDLLRAGRPLPGVPEGRSDYRLVVAPGSRRPQADLYAFGLREPIPSFPLPLARGEEEPRVELKPILDRVYDQARYDLVLDYAAPPVPPLGPEDAAWAAELLRSTGRAES